MGSCCFCIIVIREQVKNGQNQSRMEAKNAYTLPFYDTFNIESPSNGVDNLDFPTMILDVPDCVENEVTHIANECEEEVVLDSDDERMHGTEVASVSKLRSSDDTRYKQQLGEWKLSPVPKQTYVGKHLFYKHDLSLNIILIIIKLMMYDFMLICPFVILLCI